MQISMKAHHPPESIQGTVKKTSPNCRDLSLLRGEKVASLGARYSCSRIQGFGTDEISGYRCILHESSFLSLVVDTRSDSWRLKNLRATGT